MAVNVLNCKAFFSLLCKVLNLPTYFLIQGITNDELKTGSMWKETV